MKGCYIKTCLFVLVAALVGAFTNVLLFGLNDKTQAVYNKGESNLEKLGVYYKRSKKKSNRSISDVGISNTIKNILAEDPSTSSLDLNIKVVGARVTISGKAESKKQIKKIVDIALKTDGVREVVSTVIVDPHISTAGGNSFL